MDSKRLMATVVGGIVLFATGYLIFFVALADFYAANAGSATGVNRDAQLYWAAVIGSLFYAALISYALGRRGVTTIAEGAVVGGIVGFLIWGCVDFSYYSFANINNLTITIIDPIVEFVHGGIGGAAIGAMLRTGAKSA